VWEASKLLNKEYSKKRPGDPLGPPAKRLNMAIQRPRWVADVPSNIMVQGGINRGHGLPRGRGLRRGNNFI